MGIQGKISILQNDLSAENPLNSQLRCIQDYVNSAVALTSRLLGFARGGKYELRVLNLNPLVENTIEMFGRTRKELSIHTHLQEDIPAVEVDLSQIEQVLINLLVNAGQAMEEGGDITIKTKLTNVESKTAALHGLRSGRYVQLDLEDTGKGMDKKTMKKINPEVAVLLSSGYSVDGEARKILDRGCLGFIQKPFSLAEISGKIREVLNAPCAGDCLSCF